MWRVPNVAFVGRNVKPVGVLTDSSSSFEVVEAFSIADPRENVKCCMGY